MNVLIVEDEATARTALVEAIVACGGTVHLAEDERSAIEQFKSCKPEIVFTDLALPKCSGVELTKNFCTSNPGVLVVAVTGGDQEQLVIDCLKAGASDFLTKPVEPMELRALYDRLQGIVVRRQNRVLTSECLESARLELTLQTSHRAIIPTVELLTALLKGFVDPPELRHIEMALNEVIRNAYEHGNLGVTYDEKARVCEAGSLEELLAKRSEFARQLGKMIRITAEVREGKFICTIEDEGTGFDWQKSVPGSPSEISPLALNGRGLILIRRVFDTMEFNERGNRVTVTKRL